MGQQYQELINIINDLLKNRFAPKPNLVRAILGNETGEVKVPGKGNEDKSYVRFNRSATEAFPVFNKEVNPVYGWPVLIGEKVEQPGLAQVLGTDWATYEQQGWGDAVGGLDPHAPTHEWPEGLPGSDPVNVYMRAITPLKAYSLGSGSTEIFVGSFQYEHGFSGTAWPGVPGIELGYPLSTTPVTGSQRFMGIYHEPVANILLGVTGSTVPYSEAITPPLPQFPFGVNPSAWVRLYGGQNTITERDIKDARRLFNPVQVYGLASGDLTGTYPNPQVQGIVDFPIAGTLTDNSLLLFSGSSWQLVPPRDVASTGTLGWPYSNILTLDPTDTDADYNNVYEAVAGALSGQEIKFGPGLYVLTGSATISTNQLTLYSDDPKNTIISGTIDNHLFSVTGEDVVFDGLTMGLISDLNFASIIASDANRLHIKNCNMLHLTTTEGNFDFANGVWNSGGENWKIITTDIATRSNIGSGTMVGYNADSAASSVEFIDGSIEGDTSDIRLNRATAEVNLNDVTLVNDTINVILGNIYGGYYNNNAFHRTIDGNKALTVDTAGIITQPLQSSFLAFKSATAPNNVTGDGTQYRLEQDSEVWDQNFDFDTGTDTFTAPVTGKYELFVTIAISGLTSSHTFLQVFFQTSNRAYNSIIQNAWNLATSTQIYLSYSRLVDMDANDTATVEIIVSGGGLVVDILGGANVNTAFGGTLVN